MNEQDKSQMIELQLKKRGIDDDKVLWAMNQIPREKFMPENVRNIAYGDFAVPIGHGQTLSQPYITALMIQLLEPESTDKVLEIGSGSGYAVAVLAKLCSKVIGIEKISELVETSRETLKNIKIENARILHGDGSEGDIHYYPYDKVLISAACPKVPDEIINQVKMGGIIVAPVGERLHQRLIKIKKTKTGLKEETSIEVSFVPLTGKKGFNI